MSTRETILSSKVSLQRLELLALHIPRRKSFRSAIGVRRFEDVLLVRWVDLDGAFGIGECSCRADPFFNGEYVDGAAEVIEKFVFPLLPSHGPASQTIAVTSKIRGWNFAVASVLDAVFDLIERRGDADPWAGHPLPQAKVPVGVSLPLFDTPDAAVRRVSEAVRVGFQRVKLKVSPDMNVATLEAVRQAFPAAALHFDANGSGTEDDIDFFDALARLEPVALEQPYRPGRHDLCAALKKRLPRIRICLDESVSNIGDLIAAHKLDALDELNIKPGRVGGALETIRILEYCQNNDIPVWVGGMFETGVGRKALLRLAARLPQGPAHDLSPPLTYLTADIIKDTLEVDSEGFVHLDDTTVTVNEEAIDKYRRRRSNLYKI